MFIPDNPIKSVSEDTLGRRNFAEKLGDTIRDWDRKESIVIALYGPWGSGKTSVLKMAVSHIEDTTKDLPKESKPIIIRFNPWNFSGQEQLFRAFFRELLAMIRKVEPKRADDLQKLFNGVAKILGALEGLPEIGGWVSLGRKTIDLFTKDEIPLDDLREQISDLFRAFNRRIVIVLDDIDRLTQEEIRQIFKLIKVNADFPNTIYLVAFDRKVVEAALTSEQGVSGREYLEKIVQVGYDVPMVDAARISQTLEKELRSFLPATEIGFYDLAMYKTGIRPLFANLRDVKRYINGLAFASKIVQGEVNPKDYIALEAVRTFVPNIYNAIAQHKSLFTDLVPMPSQVEPTSEKPSFDKIFEGAKSDPRVGLARSICEFLFPQMSSASRHDPYSYIEQERSWRAERRICHPGIFDVYFVLGTPAGDVSVFEAQQVVGLHDKPDQIANALIAFKNDGRLFRLLVLLDDIHDQFNDPQARGLCRALLQMSTSIDDRFVDRQVADLIYTLLWKINDFERCKWFASQIQRTQDISTIIAVLINCEDNKGQIAPDSPFDAACLSDLKKLTCEAIKQLAISDLLLSRKRFIGVLAIWRKWSEDKDPFTEYIQALLGRPSDFSTFLSGFLQTPDFPTYMPGSEGPSLQLDFPKLETYANLQQLSEALALVTDHDRQTMSERQKMALQQLAEALAGSEHPGQDDTPLPE